MLSRMASIATGGATYGISKEEFFVLGRGFSMKTICRNIFIVTDPGADIDDEIALLVLILKHAQQFSSIHVIIVDGVAGRSGGGDAMVRWETFKTLFSEVFSTHAIPDNVFFHTSHTICAYVSDHKITTGKLLMIAPAWNDPQLFPFFKLVNFTHATLQGDASSYNMEGSVPDDEEARRNYDELTKAISHIEFNMIPSDVCRSVPFMPAVIEAVRMMESSFADEIEEGAFKMFAGRMPAHLPRAAAVLNANLKTALGYIKAVPSEDLTRFIESDEHTAFTAANGSLIEQYRAGLASGSGAGKMEELGAALDELMGIISFITNGSLRYEGSLSKVSDTSFGAAFDAWKQMKGDAPLTPAYDLLALVIHMNPELMELVISKDTAGLTLEVEKFVCQ